MTVTAGDRAWLALAAGVIAYEAACPAGQLLSERMDVYRSRHPVLTIGLVTYLAAHLTRAWPRRADPLYRITNWAGK